MISKVISNLQIVPSHVMLSHLRFLIAQGTINALVLITVGALLRNFKFNRKTGKWLKLCLEEATLITLCAQKEQYV